MSAVRYRVSNSSGGMRSFTADGDFKSLLSGESEIMSLDEDEHAALLATREFILVRLDPPVQADEPRQRSETPE